jgi:hypothetical protein
MLDAARKTNDAKLYQRAVEIAFQARNGRLGPVKPRGPGGRHCPAHARPTAT